jgi:DNA (cytosine-5)-methyltransferase 3A
MNILSLFDGMSCGLQALKNAGIKVDNYFASEIDKNAMIISKKNHPEIIHVGDITKLVVKNGMLIHEGKPFRINAVIGGSPCQGFSFAGKQLNFSDPRSVLFFKYAELVKKLSPDYFLLENVSMKQESKDVITQFMGVEPVMINSALLSAQNRKRLYWTNICKVEQPQDLGIKLSDIIESGFVDREKSYCIDANYFKGISFEQYLKKKRRQIVGVPIQINPSKEAGGKQSHMQNRVYHQDGKSPALTAEFAARTNVAIFNYSSSGRGDGKVEDRTNDAEKALTLTATGYSVRAFTGVLGEDFSIRKLTPVECERLQTLPDNYTEGVSNSQRYKMLGNGWTVKVIEHIFKEIKQP